MTGVDVCGGLVSSIVVCRMVLVVLGVGTDDTVCGLLEGLCTSEVGVTEEVESDGSDVIRGV